VSGLSTFDPATQEVTPTTASKTGYALTSAYDAAKTALQAGGNVVATNMVAAAPTTGQINTALEAAHGIGVWGAASIGTGTTITQLTVGTDAAPLGRVMPHGTITVSLAGVDRYQFDADADGDFSYLLPTGSIWTLTARRSGYRTTVATVSTITAVS
jgi:hypothetical protein